MSFDDVKTLIGVEDERIDIIYESVSNRLLRMLNNKLDLTVLPIDLEYIVDEVTIIRFNRLGSEGMSAESMDGHSATYVGNDFDGYISDINDYIDKETDTDATRGKAVFL